MKTGVVILNYHSKELTEKLALSLVDSTAIHYIVIVDNNSGESFDEIVDDKIFFIQNAQNTGYAQGNNVGLRWLKENTDCEYAFIANPDVVVTEETIKNIVEFLHANNDFAIASSKRISASGRLMGQYWNMPTYQELFFSAFSLYARKRSKQYIVNTTKRLFETELTNNYIEVEVVPGAFFGMKLTLIADLNYLDEHTFLYYEENILAKKLHNKGYKSAIISNCIYEHNHIHSIPKFLHAKSFVHSKNWYAKNYLHCGKFKMAILYITDIYYYITFGIKTFIKKFLRHK